MDNLAYLVISLIFVTFSKRFVIYLRIVNIIVKNLPSLPISVYLKKIFENNIRKNYKKILRKVCIFFENKTLVCKIFKNYFPK